MLAIMHALREWQPVLIVNSKLFPVYTDHISLRFFKEPQDLSYRHARWSIELVDYPMTIAYIKGSHNVIADSLSLPHSRSRRPPKGQSHHPPTKRNVAP